MNLNEFELTNHCETDHKDRWDLMRKVVNNDLGEIIYSVYDGNATLCLSNTGVYAVVNLTRRVIITAYLPSLSRVNQLYGRKHEEMPLEIKRLLRRNEKREWKFINKWA